MPRIADLPLSLPVLAAPMAGGATTPALVTAAAGAGSLALLAGGYRDAPELAEQIREVRSGAEIFGVNLFAPNPIPVDPAAYTRYALDLAPVARRFAAALPGRPVEDDDGWSEKLDVLLSDPVPLVSFTFGLPPTGAIRGLRRAGSAVAQTVTTAQEARSAQDVGVDLLVVQGPGAGGHSAVFDPTDAVVPRTLAEVVREVRAATRLPVIAGGGIADSADVAEALRAGAAAVAVGTALLLADEAGTSAVHRRAIADRAGPTRMTHAFTGRPARGLANEFMARFDRLAPVGYPALHHLTGPLRKAAAIAGDPEWVHLWAGTGHRAVMPGSVAEILARLAV
jgi:NAD(P)H-dependent flavin oxidoreductase YrpB (nitropropane dioxygenase family)